MDFSTAHRLRQMNNDFYAHTASSFASTRNNSWHGWERCLLAMGPESPRKLSVLDVACGTMRFNRWLHQKLPDADIRYQGIDSCADLVPDALEMGTSFLQVDILQQLFDRVWPADDGSADADEALGPFGADFGWLSQSADVSPCDLVTCFGFMHHVPGEDARRRILRALVECAKEGGLVAVSFWQFMNSKDLARRAQETTQTGLFELEASGDGEAESSCAVSRGRSSLLLDKNDYLLGWNGSTEHLRYCHHFDACELDRMVSAVSDIAWVEDRFDCDGRTGNLNGYLVLRRLTN